jgi:dTMP kinase
MPLAFESSEPDRMERSGIEFYRRVRQGYLDLVDESDGRMVRLNALDKPEHIHKRVIQYLGKLEKRCECEKGGCC